MKQARYIANITINTLIGTTAACLLTVQTDAATIDLGTFSGHQYLYDTASYLSFDDANLAAQALGFQLVSITSAAENNFLILAITPFAPGQLRDAWIGLTRPTSGDPFTWPSGESFSYVNWRPAGVGTSFPEPTNGAGETNAVFYVNEPQGPEAPLGPVPVGYWADTFHSNNSVPFNAIYETPEPSTTLFLAAGVLGIASRRIRIQRNG